jgi:fluoroacetyl-CoA thioesterase
MSQIPAGLSYVISQKVEVRHTAAELGSGTLPVFATPALVALAEKACMLLVEKHLLANQTTVGVEIHISHVKATPLGKSVYAEAVLLSIDNKKLSFSVKAWDDDGDIGFGQHVRFIVDAKRFMEKANG